MKSTKFLHFFFPRLAAHLGHFRGCVGSFVDFPNESPCMPSPLVEMQMSFRNKGDETRKAAAAAAVPRAMLKMLTHHPRAGGAGGGGINDLLFAQRCFFRCNPLFPSTNALAVNSIDAAPVICDASNERDFG